MEIKTVEDQTTLMVRTITPVSDLPDLMGRVYGAIGAYMQEHGVPFAGNPYARYHNMDMEALDVEVGFPVPGDHAAVAGQRDVEEANGGTAPRLPTGHDLKIGHLPGGRVVTGTHTGPYAAMETTYNALVAYAEKQKVRLTPWMYEYYLNSPAETPETELQTQIVFPIDE